MNILTQNTATKMTSQQIADLVGSRHDKVKQSIERLVNNLVIIQPSVGDEQSVDAMGRSRMTQVYVFSGEQGKRDSIIVVAQLSPEFTGALVDRWQELEHRLAQPATKLPDFTNPVEAARAFADQYEAKQIAQEQLLLAQPKVAHYDSVVDRKGLLNATQVGQKVGMSAVKLNRILDELKVYNQSIKRSRVFNSWFIQQGLGELKQTPEGHSQALFSLRGEAWVVERLISEGVV